MKMKSFFFKALIAFPLLIAGGGCGDDKTADDQPPVSDPTIKLEAGTPTQTSITLLISATEAEQMAYLIRENSDEIVAATAEEIFRDGIILNASADPVTITKKDLNPGVEYFVQAAAKSKNLYSAPETLTVSTVEIPRLIYFESSSKTNFSYRIAHIAADQIVYHTYLEKWAYDKFYAQYKLDFGEDFNLDYMLTDILADYGFEATGPQTVTWNAGDENPPREGIASIVGGKEYYAIACPFDVDEMKWGKPETVTFKTEDPGKSAAIIDIFIDELTPEGLVSRIEPDNTIAYYFYLLYPKRDVDIYIKEFGQEKFENQTYEKGYIAENSYTDRWEFSVPTAEYLLAVVGVDKNGDTMYAEKIIDAPDYQADILISMQPYENELQGYFDYQSIEVAVAPSYFGDTSFDEMMWALTPKTVIDAALEMAGGSTLEECVADGYIPTYPLTEEWAAALNDKGSFTEYFNDLEPETEYYFIVATPDPKNGEQIMVRYATAATKAVPDTTNPDPEYLAYLGSWKLDGKSTEDWSSPISYDITIEQLTPNRSFKVKGWSKSNIGHDFPFVMNYDPATKKHFIKAPQTLGTYIQDRMKLEVVFAGLFVHGLTDGLSIYTAPTYTAYTGRINGDQMSFFSEFFQFEGTTHEFRSIGYAGYSSDDNFHTFTGDEFNPVYFKVTKSSENAVATQPRRAGIGGKCSFVTNWLKPQNEVRIPLRPAAAQPQTVPASASRISPAFAEKLASDPRGISIWRKADPLQGVPRAE